ncbi:MAG: hypothetical protein ACI81W_003569, partial [Saprospiraceae bacterium]
FANGMYVIQLFDDSGVSLGVEQFEVLR